MILADALISLRNLIIGLNVAAAVFLLGVVATAIRERRRRPVHAPNQESYHEDDVMEGARLERVLAWALGLFAVVAVTLPAYWLIEPERQEAMDEQFLETSVEHGAELFAVQNEEEAPNGLGCAGCHGPEGGGGSTVQIIEIPVDEIEVAEGAIDSDDRVCAPNPEDDASLVCQVTWEAPALNDVLLRFSREEVRDVIVYGRPGTPMPAWGLEGGGAKNDQSVDNILDYIESIQVSPDEARAQQAELADGAELFQANCARCHTKHWSYVGTFAITRDQDNNVVPRPSFDIFGVAGGGAFGPDLTGDVTERQFPDIEDHIDFIRTGSDFQAPYGTRGIGSGRMPGFSLLLTDDQIRAIAEYERSLTDERILLDTLIEIPEPEAGADAEAPDEAEEGAGAGDDAGAGDGAEGATTTTSGGATTTAGFEEETG